MGNAAQGVWNVGWLNANSQRRYPLSEEANVRDTTDTFSIPNDFIVDLLWPVHADASIDPRLFHIASIAIFGAGVTVAIGYNGTVIGSASIDAAAFQPNTPFFINGTGDFFDTVGKIVIGSLKTVQQSAGSFQFDVANGRIEQTAIKPDLRGVTALYLRNGVETIGPLQDDLILQSGERVLLNLIKVPGERDRIIINAIDGIGLNEDCNCQENQDLPCIQTINGLGPDEDGNFLLLDDECLKLQAIANGLQLNEECAQPCCGCEELKIVRDTLEFVVQSVQNIENASQRLESAIQTLQINCMQTK